MAITPQRPGARRPAAGGPPSQAGRQQSKGPSIEELMALPEVIEDGENLSLDPSNVSDGGFGAGEGHNATISAARFGKFVYMTKEGTVSLDKSGEPIKPSLDLFVTYDREGFDKPTVVRYGFARWDQFGISADGNHPVPRPSYVKAHDGYIPKPYKFTAGSMFLKSIQDAGLSSEKLQKEGAAALVGLTVHVRIQRVAGQSETGRAPLLVDYIEPSTTGGTSTGTAAAAKSAGRPKAQTSSSPAKETAKTDVKTVAAAATVAGPDTSEVSALAEEALLDILTAAEGNTVMRAQIPTTLIQSAKWSKHESRGSILKLLRTDEFITREDAPWTFDGTSISLA